MRGPMAVAMVLLQTVGSVVLIAGATGIAMGLWGRAGCPQHDGRPDDAPFFRARVTRAEF